MLAHVGLASVHLKVIVGVIGDAAHQPDFASWLVRARGAFRAPFQRARRALWAGWAVVGQQHPRGECSTAEALAFRSAAARIETVNSPHHPCEPRCALPEGRSARGAVAPRALIALLCRHLVVVGLPRCDWVVLTGSGPRSRCPRSRREEESGFQNPCRCRRRSFRAVGCRQLRSRSVRSTSSHSRRMTVSHGRQD